MRLTNIVFILCIPTLSWPVEIDGDLEDDNHQEPGAADHEEGVQYSLVGLGVVKQETQHRHFRESYADTLVHSTQASSISY